MKFRLPTRHNQDQCWKGTIRASSSLVAAGTAEVVQGPALAFPKQPEAPGFLRALGRQLWLWFCLLFFSVVSYTICNHFILTSVVIQGKSMHPTLREGEHYLLDRWTYRYSAPQRSDLVVLRDPGHSDYAVKRLIALPGETVRISRGKVYLNNKLLTEPYLAGAAPTFLPNGDERTFILGAEQYFVMGDNRPVSEDSRYYGPISRDSITGHIAIR